MRLSWILEACPLGPGQKVLEIGFPHRDNVIACLLVGEQRRQYKLYVSAKNDSEREKMYNEGVMALSAERAARLNEIGFETSNKNPRHMRWDFRYNQLKEFSVRARLLFLFFLWSWLMLLYYVCFIHAEVSCTYFLLPGQVWTHTRYVCDCPLHCKPNRPINSF